MREYDHVTDRTAGAEDGKAQVTKGRVTKFSDLDKPTGKTKRLAPETKHVQRGVPEGPVALVETGPYFPPELNDKEARAYYQPPEGLRGLLILA